MDFGESERMNIAVVGSSGYIAGFIIDRLQKENIVENILKIDQNINADVYLDLADAVEFDYSVLDNVDFVIFTAAISGPDKCAQEFDFCWNINVTGTGYFINKAIERNCRVLFFSSDAVFGDIPGAIYTEKSETKAQTPYGKMKKAVEDRFKDCELFKAIRLSYVVSAKDRFVSYCLDCISQNAEADIFHPFYRNCISVSDVVDVVIWFMHNWEQYEYFVLNVAGKELVSRLRIADEINRITGNKLKYKISCPGDDFYTNRPSVTQMVSLFMNKYAILRDITFTEKISKELEDVKNE